MRKKTYQNVKRHVLGHSACPTLSVASALAVTVVVITVTVLLEVMA